VLFSASFHPSSVPIHLLDGNHLAKVAPKKKNFKALMEKYTILPGRG